MDPELEEQMKMLEGLDMTSDLGPAMTSPVQPEPTVVNEAPSFVQPVQQVVTPTMAVDGLINEMQKQVNDNATAQTVVTSTTVVAPVQPVQKVNNPVAAPAQPVQTAPAMDLNQAPVFVNLAASAYQTKTDFLSLKDGEKTKVTLANLNFIRNHIHFIDGLGKIRCLSGYDENNRWPVNRAICCQFIDEKTGKQQNAKNRLLVPVIEYPVSKTDGKTVIQGAKPKLKMWDMNYVEEKQLMDILENYKTGDDWSTIDISSFDLNLIKGKSGEFSTITLTPMPSWRNNFLADINAELTKINQDFYNDAYKESARTVTEQSIHNAMLQKQQQDLAAQQIANQPIPDQGVVNLNM